MDVGHRGTDLVGVLQVRLDELDVLRPRAVLELARVACPGAHGEAANPHTFLSFEPASTWAGVVGSTTMLRMKKGTSPVLASAQLAAKLIVLCT